MTCFDAIQVLDHQHRNSEQDFHAGKHFISRQSRKNKENQRGPIFRNPRGYMRRKMIEALALSKEMPRQLLTRHSVESVMRYYGITFISNVIPSQLNAY